jgi:hypothetical protein
MMKGRHRAPQVILLTATIAIVSVLAVTITHNYGWETELEEYTYSQVWLSTPLRIDVF